MKSFTLTIDSAARRIGLVVIIALLVAAHWYIAKWSFANMASSRTDLPEIADLAISWAPGDPQTHYAAGVLYDKTFLPQDQQRSLEEYAMAVALSPQNYLLWLEYGKALARSGDPNRAERALRQAQVLAPNYAIVQWTLGNFLIQSGKPDDGFDEVRRAISGNPTYASPAASIMYQYFDGDVGRVLDVIGDSPAANAALALLLVKAGRFSESADVWLSVQRSDSDESIKSVGQTLSAQLINAKRFSLAEKVSSSLDANVSYSPGQIFDGGFEQGVKLESASAFEWQITAGSQPQVLQSSARPHGGARSLVLVFNSADGNALRQVSQTIVVKSKGKYLLQGFYRSELKSAAAMVWQIVDTSNGAVVATIPLRRPAADWQQFSDDFVVPADTEAIMLKLTRENCGTPVCPINGNIWFDDLALIER